MLRRFRQFIIAVSLCVCLCSRGTVAQTWVAKHGLTDAQYHFMFEDLGKKEYRLASVSGYASGGSIRFAAHWEKSAGRGWVSGHKYTADGYQKAFEEYKKQGYRLTWIDGYQAGGQLRFAAIWDKGTGPAREVRHGLTDAEYQQSYDNLTKQGYRLIHICGYNGGGSIRYAVIYEKSSGPTVAARHGLTAAEYQQAFEELSENGYRLKVVSGCRVDGKDTYAAIWEKVPGSNWSARHGIPDSWCQNLFDNYRYEGYRPKYISAFASGGGGKLNSIWENTTVKAAELNLVASQARVYMKKYAVPGMAIAIAKDGRLVYAAGFGFADKSTGAEVGPENLFRIASVSKPITAVAIMKLVEARTLSLDEKVFGPGSILGSKYPTPPGNERINKITVRHLLQHVSGFSNTPDDPMFQNTSLTHDELIKWVLNDLTRVVMRDPAKQYEYLNFGYCLLGRIIERKSGQSYEDFVKQSVLAPSGVTEMTIARNEGAERRPREVVYYPSGAYSLNVRRFDAHGGWIANPIDLLRFLVRVDGSPTKPDIISSASHTLMITKAGVKDIDGKDPNYGLGWVANPQMHNGAMRGTLAILTVTSNGFTYAALANTRPANDPFAANLKTMMQNIIDGFSAWPTYDLF